MGSKIEAKALLADAGVPMLPTLDRPDRGRPSSRCWSRRPPAAAAAACASSATPTSLAEAVASARREAAAAFGDGTVFCERYVERARHIEVQIIADTHGNVVPLGERECSIQRRHQKIIEETPSPAVTPELREQLCAAAVAAAPGGRLRRRRHGRVPARRPDGELLLPGDEHPPAGRAPGHRAASSGFDLVRLQLLVAEGGAAAVHRRRRRCAGTRSRCGCAPRTRRTPGCRATGTLHRFQVPGGGRRVPAAARSPACGWTPACGDGSVVGVHYDSMLAKLDRLGADPRTRPPGMLAGALARARDPRRGHQPGPAGAGAAAPGVPAPATSTPASSTGTPRCSRRCCPRWTRVRLSCLAAALAGAAARRAAAPVLGAAAVRLAQRARPARRPPCTTARPARSRSATGWTAPARWPSWWVRAVDPDELDLAGLGQAPARPTTTRRSRSSRPPPDRVVLDVAGVRLAFAVHRVGDVSYVDSPRGLGGADRAAALPAARRRSWPRARCSRRCPARSSRVLVVPGQRVAAGDLLHDRWRR